MNKKSALAAAHMCMKSFIFRTSLITASSAGASIGFYTIQRVIGQGGFGKVLLCQHKLTNEPVAVKVLRQKHYAALKHPFPPQELEVMKNLRHHNICTLLDVIDCGKKVDFFF